MNESPISKKEGYAMYEDTVVSFSHPDRVSIEDPLTAVLRSGARRLLAEAVEAEVEAFIAAHVDLLDEAGRRRVVRHGYLPEREVQTGIGAVAVRRPRVRDRQPDAGDGRIHFTSSILPPYLRRAKSVEELLPWLYLKGISTGNFGEALAALLGADAPGLSATTIARLKALDAARSRGQALCLRLGRRHLLPAPPRSRQAMPVGDHRRRRDRGTEDVVGLSDGYRESAQSWLELLLDLKRRGLEVPPELAIGDGALGFWKALRQAYGQTREQRCWVHKTATVLNKLPKSLQSKAKAHLQDIWMAETRGDAESAFDFFLQAYGAKYDKAVECLARDRDRLLSFYDFPAEHWKHLRSTNPIESTFATVRLRTTKTKGCLSRSTALAMVFKLLLSARRKWRRLDGSNHLAELIQGVIFKDGIKQIQHAA